MGTLRAGDSGRAEDAGALKTLSEFGLDILYARAKTKLWNKIERLRGVPGLSVADFGTRRRHSFLWQEYVVVAMAANLGSNFIGTSNAFLAHKHDLEAIGTNAHEIPMVMAALAPRRRRAEGIAIPRARACGSRPMKGRCGSCCPTRLGRRSFLQALRIG